ncbi:MAG: ligase-associated DNA damage response endonuclease PdeM [Phaeodactylibacter sp.]|uniref:ligase-associated DNA damage response endonuclease PdeM n=1 Tax=Phaeodactylibacter sp. TaxID=1940289 RepID=UPI0032ECDB83
MVENLSQIQGIYRYEKEGQHFWLHPFRAAYWEEEKILLIADLHLGKVQHFRKAGIAVPASVGQENWDRLISLLWDFQPERVLFLGDLFHSEYNRDWEELRSLTQQFGAISFELVEGNHDILSPETYRAARLQVHEEPYRIGRFLLSHHPMEKVPESSYNLAGHIHPGVVLGGMGRQRMRLPCFWFGKVQALMPAFGAFTGTAVVKPKAGDEVFVLAEEHVVQVC